jgi:hypothetical protein
MKDRLWRLLGACESLTRRESAALAHRDFEALCRTHDLKADLLADLAVEAQRTHASCDSSARARLTHLLGCNRQNARILAAMKAGTSEDLRKVRTAGNTLQNLSAYKGGNGQRQQSFSAHG